MQVVAARQGWRCSACNELLPAAYQVDHTVPLCEGGRDNLSNATAMCANCHAAKTQQEAIARAVRSTATVMIREDREDVVVGKELVRCSSCFYTRAMHVPHEVCMAIEMPGAKESAIAGRLSVFAFDRAKHGLF